VPPSNRPQTEEYPLHVHLRRALARRFPRTTRGWHWTVANIESRLRGLAGRFRPRRLADSFGWLTSTIRTVLQRRREPRLTVAVEVSAFWEPLTGIGWYLYRLLEHLADHRDIRVRLYGPSVIESPDLPKPTVELPQGPAIETISYAVPERFLLPAGWITRILRRLEPLLIAADRNRVLFAPNYFLPRRFRLAAGARVSTVHDLGFRRFPWALRQETLNDLADKFEHSVRESSRIISVSGAVRDELAAFGYVDPARVTVVHHGPGQLSTVEPGRLPQGLPSRYALHVGTIEPRKNVGTLLQAWRILRQRLSQCPDLVLCGRYGWKTDVLQRQVEAAEKAGWAHHLGYVEDPELAALFRSAQAVIFPSHYEGFGLPAVEALWAGVPLVASDIPVLREVTDGAALFAPDDDPAALADAVERALFDRELRQDLVERGLRRITELSWSRAARQTEAVWRQAAGMTAATTLTTASGTGTAERS